LELNAEVKELHSQIAELVQKADTTLTEICGIGSMLAARILGEVGDIRRFPTPAAFAAANGSAPIPASSGRTEHYRLNRGGIAD